MTSRARHSPLEPEEAPAQYAGVPAPRAVAMALAILLLVACGGSGAQRDRSARPAGRAQQETMFGMPLSKEPKPSPYVGRNEMAPPNQVQPTLEPSIIPSGREDPELSPALTPTERQQESRE